MVVEYLSPALLEDRAHSFAPVFVGLGNAEARTADGLLQEWGALGKEASFLDGGVLLLLAVRRRSLDVATEKGNMRIAQVAPLIESAPPKHYGGTERIVFLSH